MKFHAPVGRHFGGGIGGFFRPIIRFFKNILMPSAKRIGKSAIKSKVGKSSIKALKKAAVGMTADAISGGITGDTPTTHISKARSEIADAIRETQSTSKNKRKRIKKKFAVRSAKTLKGADSFFN